MQIKETMQRYGYTTATLAKKMGVFDSTVSRLMNGNPTIQKLRDLAAAIGCPLWEFFADEMSPSPALPQGEGAQQPAPAAIPFGGTTGSQPSATSGSSDAATPQPLALAHQPSLQQAIICPHCGHALVFNIVSYEQK